MIIKNGKSIAPFHRFAVTDFSSRRATETLAVKGKCSEAAKPWFCRGLQFGGFGHGFPWAGPVSAPTHWVTHKVRAPGQSGFPPTLWFSKRGGVEGRYLLSDEREGARWEFFHVRAKQKEQQTERKEQSSVIRLGCKVS